MRVRQSISLEQELVDFLDDFKAKYKVAKSVIIQCLLNFYVKDPEGLFKLVISDINRNEHSN